MTAESMMRDQAAAGLYAPLRVVLYEEPGGNVFAYDRPALSQLSAPESSAVNPSEGTPNAGTVSA